MKRLDRTWIKGLFWVVIRVEDTFSVLVWDLRKVEEGRGKNSLSNLLTNTMQIVVGECKALENVVWDAIRKTLCS